MDISRERVILRAPKVAGLMVGDSVGAIHRGGDGPQRHLDAPVDEVWPPPKRIPGNMIMVSKETLSRSSTGKEGLERQRARLATRRYDFWRR